MVVIGKDLFGAGNVARRTFQINGIGSQVNIDIQAVFQQAQVFVARAEQSLDVGADFNALLHLCVWLFFDAPFPTLDAQSPVQEEEFVACNPIRLTAGRIFPAQGQTILMSGGGTSRGCSPRGTGNCHYGKGYPCSRMRVNAAKSEFLLRGTSNGWNSGHSGCTKA